MSYVERKLDVFQTTGAQDPTKQQSVRDFIKSVDSMFIESGLLRSPLENQLDPLNIPNMDISDLFGIYSAEKPTFDPLKNEGLNVTETVFTRCKKYNPLEYVFDDMENALKIKLEFYYFVSVIRSSTSSKESPMLGCYVTVLYQGNKYTKNCIIPFSYIIVTSTINTYVNFHLPTFPNTEYLENINSGNRTSIVSYSKESGHLLVYILPSVSSGFLLGSSGIRFKPFMFFCISRSRSTSGTPNSDYIRFLTDKAMVTSALPSNSTTAYSYGGSSYSIAGIDYISNRLSLYTFFSDGTVLSNIYEQFSIPLSSITQYKNYSYTSFMSNVENKIKLTLDFDPFILVGSAEMSGNISDKIYKIKLNDGTTKHYLAISAIDIYSQFENLQTVFKSLLIQIEKPV